MGDWRDMPVRGKWVRKYRRVLLEAARRFAALWSEYASYPGGWRAVFDGTRGNALADLRHGVDALGVTRDLRPYDLNDIVNRATGWLVCLSELGDGAPEEIRGQVHQVWDRLGRLDRPVQEDNVRRARALEAA